MSFPSKKWQQQPLPVETAQRVQPHTKLFRRSADSEGGLLYVMVSPPYQGVGWHMSISHRTSFIAPDGKAILGRYPTWDEIKEARYTLLPPDVTMALLLPPENEYVNLHATTFHLHQVPGERDRADQRQ